MTAISPEINLEELLRQKLLRLQKENASLKDIYKIKIALEYPYLNHHGRRKLLLKKLKEIK